MKWTSSIFSNLQLRENHRLISVSEKCCWQTDPLILEQVLLFPFLNNSWTSASIDFFSSWDIFISVGRCFWPGLSINRIFRHSWSLVSFDQFDRKLVILPARGRFGVLELRNQVAKPSQAKWRHTSITNSAISKEILLLSY